MVGAWGPFSDFRTVALQTQDILLAKQIGVARAVNVMAGEAGHPASVHNTLNEIVSLHSVFVRGAVGEMSEALLA